MNPVKKLYELQTLDLEIRSSMQEIEEINTILADRKVTECMEQELTAIKQRITGQNGRKKDLEFEIDDIRRKTSQLSQKLYGGGVKIPKELMSLEQDLSDHKKRLEQKEDALLEIMEDSEKLEAERNVVTRRLTEHLEVFEVEAARHNARKHELEKRIEELQSSKKIVCDDIETETLKAYERLIARKGMAVARVEQGRCQGCRIALPVQQLQNARSGPVFCSSCGMFLYLS